MSRYFRNELTGLVQLHLLIASIDSIASPRLIVTILREETEILSPYKRVTLSLGI